MWKLKNKLFGWDYVLWKNSADSGIARVIVFKDGTIGYWRYRILTNGTNVFDEINNPKEVHWLTCHPSKYFKEENANDNLPICNIKGKSHEKIMKSYLQKKNMNDKNYENVDRNIK